MLRTLFHYPTVRLFILLFWVFKLSLTFKDKNVLRQAQTMPIQLYLSMLVMNPVFTVLCTANKFTISSWLLSIFSFKLFLILVLIILTCVMPKSQLLKGAEYIPCSGEQCIVIPLYDYNSTLMSVVIYYFLISHFQLLI